MSNLGGGSNAPKWPNYLCLMETSVFCVCARVCLGVCVFVCAHSFAINWCALLPVTCSRSWKKLHLKEEKKKLLLITVWGVGALPVTPPHSTSTPFPPTHTSPATSMNYWWIKTNFETTWLHLEKKKWKTAFLAFFLSVIFFRLSLFLNNWWIQPCCFSLNELVMEVEMGLLLLQELWLSDEPAAPWKCLLEDVNTATGQQGGHAVKKTHLWDTRRVSGRRRGALEALWHHGGPISLFRYAHF